MTKENRMTIAEMVRPVWAANQPAAGDRSIALSMLISNLEHEERENKAMLYSCGTLTPDQIAKAKEIWKEVPKDYRGYERHKILEIAEDLKW